VGGIEGGVFSSAFPDGIPAPSKTKREAESLAKKLGRYQIPTESLMQHLHS
jgi:hypothetical protein